MGVLGGASTENGLYVTYTTDANYTADNNTNTYQISFPKDSGTLALSKNHVLKTGDTMTGLLTMYREGTTAQDYPAGFKFSVKDTTTGKTYSSDAYIYAYQDHASTTYGTNMVINPGGCMFIGAGESAGAHYSAIKANIGTSEWMYLTADAGIYLQGKGNSIANRCGMYITGSSTETAHQIVPCVADTLTNNVGSIGTATYRWGYMFATQFNGKLGQYSSAVLNDTGRPTSANLTTAGDRTMQLIQSTTSMTTGKPSTDGYILNFDWDNAGNYQTQLFLANSVGLNHVQFRAQWGSADWTRGRWVTLLSERNSPAFNRIFDRYYVTPTSTGWIRILTIGSFNNNGRVYGMYRITITRTYSNNSPEVLSFEVMNNYATSPKIYFLKSNGTHVFTNIRIVKSADGSEQYLDIYHSVSTYNYLSIRYEIFEPYDMLDTNNKYPITVPTDESTLTILSEQPASVDIMTQSVTIPSTYVNGLKYSSYWGLTGPEAADDSIWLRTTTRGFIPDQQGAAGSGHASLGSSSWFFKTAYIDEIYAGAVGKNCYISYPVGGVYNVAGSNSVEGAFLITTPITTSATCMLKMTVDIYNGVKGTSAEYQISGFANSDSKWYYTSVVAIGGTVNNVSDTSIGNLTVRFGYQDSKFCIQIGEVRTESGGGSEVTAGTRWAWPKLVIRDIMITHNATSFDTYKTGWSISLFNTVNTPISNITATHKNTSVHWAANTIACSHTNEVNFSGPTSGSQDIWFGYRKAQPDGTETKTAYINNYRFGNGNGSATAGIHCGQIKMTTGSYSNTIVQQSGMTANRTITLPDTSGILSVWTVSWFDFEGATQATDVVVPDNTRYLKVYVTDTTSNVSATFDIKPSLTVSPTSVMNCATVGQTGLDLVLVPLQFNFTNEASGSGYKTYTLGLVSGASVRLSASTTPQSGGTHTPKITLILACCW